ncbi:MAG: NTP transferase domain-containing protein, partial [Rhodoblastus sp.]|nr:NTP transferase domain-containing protein [Rhodoblastus sp.]
REAYNADFANGIAASVKTGLAALPPGVDGALVFLGDMPRVTAALGRRLIDAFAADPSADAVAPLVAGRRGNPVLLARTLFAAAQALDGDEGARKLLMRPDLRVVEIEAPGAAAAVDIDTPEALRRLSVGSQ